MRFRRKNSVLLTPSSPSNQPRGFRNRITSSRKILRLHCMHIFEYISHNTFVLTVQNLLGIGDRRRIEKKTLWFGVRLEL